MGLLDDVDESKIADEVMSELGGGFTSESDQPEPQPRYQVHQVVDTSGPEEVVQETTFDDIETEAIEAELSEVERRLAKAQLYKQFITQPIFDGTGDIVKEVEVEFQTFARKQLQTLMGVISQPEPIKIEAQFSDDEVKVLKAFIGRILQNPKLQKTVVPTPPKKTAVIVAPAVKPVAPIKKPALRTRVVPEEVPQVKQQPKPVKAQTALPPPRQTVVPADGSVIEEHGQKFKVKYVDMSNPDEFGIMDGMKIRKLGNKQTCMLSNGIQVLKDGNSHFKLLRTVVTSNQAIPGYQPFPTKDQMEAISANESSTAQHSLPSLQGILRQRS
jgi:hypothetical protein